jgi:trimeric autotransporter adhesin
MPISTIGSNSLNQTSDLTINGQTVGKGGGNTSTNTVHGVSTLTATNTIGDCTAVGYQALKVTTGKQNTAVGSNAGASMTSGEGLAAFGWNAANLNTGDNITALGHNTLGANTTGANSTAVGNAALNVNTTGGSNTAVGRQALVANTTASNNVAVGFQAGYSNTTASENTFLAKGAGYSNTTGAFNLFVGYHAGYYNTTGNYNTFVGHASGPVTTASATGSYNTAVGQASLAASTTANSNTAVGYNAGTAATGGSNTFIGTNAGVSGTPTTTGTNNTYIGSSAYGANAGSTKEIVIGFNFQGNGSNTCAIGSDNGKIYSNFTINATWTQTSDGRMKTNIQDDSLGLSFINRLRPIKFTWKPSNELEQDNPYYAEENTRDTTTVIHGLIAQEVKAALDAEGVNTFAGWDMGADGIQAISREMFVTPLIKAIQELKTIVDAQAAEIAELKAKVA